VRREKKRVNYYPFGLKHQGYNNAVNGTEHPFKYQGQELTEDFEMNTYEWKYRVSDPAIGRFWQIDPLAEDYEWMTTYQFSSNQPIHASELEGLENGYDLNTRLYMEGEISKEQYFKNHETRALGTVIGLTLAADLATTKGAVTKELLKQTAVGSIFNSADQLISGEEFDFSKAMSDAADNADLFDGGVSALVKKMPGGVIVSEAIEHLAPSMVDVTLKQGVQIGGVNKSMSDVAVDFGFGASTQRVKGADLPKMKFSGNTMVKNLKNQVVDYTSKKGSDKTKTMSFQSKSFNTNLRHKDPRLMNQKIQDNTRVKQTVIKAHGN